MELHGIKMACLGDSITEGVGVSNMENMYYNRIQRECGIRALYIDGIGGTRIARQKLPSPEPRKDLYFRLVQPNFTSPLCASLFSSIK